MSKVASSIKNEYSKIKMYTESFIYKNKDSQFNLLISVFNLIIRDVFLNKVVGINIYLKNLNKIDTKNYSTVKEKVKALKTIFQDMSNTYHNLIIVDNIAKSNQEDTNKFKIKPISSYDNILETKFKIVGFNNNTEINFNSVMDIINYLDKQVTKLKDKASKDKNYYQGKLNSYWERTQYYIFSWFTIPFNGTYKNIVKDYDSFLDNNIISSKLYIKNFKREILAASDLFSQINITLDELLTKIENTPNVDYSADVQNSIINVESNIASIATKLKIVIA